MEKYFPTQPILEYLHCKMVIATLTLHSSPGFYDPTELVYSPAHSPAHSAGRTTRLEQTIFLVLASLAGVAFMVIITLLLCRFQCQVASSTSSADTISTLAISPGGRGRGRGERRPRHRGHGHGLHLAAVRPGAGGDTAAARGQRGPAGATT